MTDVTDLLADRLVITDEALAKPEKVTTIELEMMMMLDLQGADSDALAEQLRSAAGGLFQGPLALVNTQPADVLSYYSDATVNPSDRRSELEAKWANALSEHTLTADLVAKLITRAGLLPIHEFVEQSAKVPTRTG